MASDLGPIVMRCYLCRKQNDHTIGVLDVLMCNDCFECFDPLVGQIRTEYRLATGHRATDDQVWEWVLPRAKAKLEERGFV